MVNRNASATSFGWDFQINAGLILVLENYKSMESLRIEGKDEDVELSLSDGSKIYAQAKSVLRFDDTTNIIAKLKDALCSLNDAAKNEDAKLFTYLTNSPNPFNNKNIMGAFYGLTHLSYDELPKIAQDKIINIVAEKQLENIDLDKFDIRVIPFFGNDLSNRYKVVHEEILKFLSSLDINSINISHQIMGVWQNMLFHNSTQGDLSINLLKKNIMWPLIVLIFEDVQAIEYKKTFNDEEISIIEEQYKSIINYQTLDYSFVLQVITDHKLSKRSIKDFIELNWQNYLYRIETLDIDEAYREVLIKIIIYRILFKKDYINNMRKEINL